MLITRRGRRAMTDKAAFTPDEWDLIREGPPTAGMITLTAEKGGTFRETFALAKAYTDARKEHGESELLDSLVAERPDVKRYHSPQELNDVGLQRLTEAVQLLEQKANPDEVAAYKKFVLDIAERVAEAHKEEGTEVSGAERSAIDKISASLNPTA
jgi:hypothetical protein